MQKRLCLCTPHGMGCGGHHCNCRMRGVLSQRFLEWQPVFVGIAIRDEVHCHHKAVKTG
jgi:hypothetical protein